MSVEEIRKTARETMKNDVQFSAAYLALFTFCLMFSCRFFFRKKL